MQRFQKLFLLICLVFLPLSLQAEEEPYYLSAVAIFRNGARLLPCWIEYHHMMGVEHFYLFNNLSTDNYKEAIQPYIDRGVVELIEWPNESASAPELWGIMNQAYNHILPRARAETKWLAVIDIDEYIFPVEETNLKDSLKEYEPFGGLCLHWRVFGTSNYRLEEGELLVEHLLFRASDTYRLNYAYKSIVQPKRTESISVHSSIYKRGYFAVNEEKIRISGLNQQKFPSWSLGWENPLGTMKRIYIKHYTEGDDTYYYNVKAPYYRKCNLKKEEDLHPNQELNQVYDPSILPLVPELKRRLQETFSGY